MFEPQRTQRDAEETNNNWFSSASLCVLCGSTEEQKSLAEANPPRLELLPRRPCEQLVELRPPRPEPPPPTRRRQQRRAQIRHHHVVAERARLGKHPAVRVEDHRVAGADLVAVGPDA